MACATSRRAFARPLRRLLLGALVIALAEGAVVLALMASVSVPAAAQVFDDRFPFLEQRQRRNYSGGNESRQASESNAKAPSPARKTDSAPLTSVVVLGDSMADWLAYGLEQAAAESPDIGILRRHRTYSGLIRTEVKHDPRGEYPDWPQAAREVLNADKVDFVVMMIGLNDRRSIREKAPAAKPGAPAATTQPAPARQPQDAERDSAPDEPPAAPESEPEPAVPGTVSYEFRSDKWTELYIKRIDETIASLKAKNVPVFWVGLPPVRSPKVSADLSYLNDLYRSRAEKAGITYIDTWDGFIDEAGRFVMQGPDFEGQIRRLRSADGIHFTQAGARKLAHYVEREIQRSLMTRATPVALPATDEPPAQAPAVRSGPTPRPLAGPVMPLTTPSEADELLGGTSAHQTASDAIASRVLVRGEATHVPAGRADDFAWPRRGVAPLGTDPVVATTTTPMTPMQGEQQHAPEKAAAIGPPKPTAPARGAGASTRQAGSRPSQREQQQQQARSEQRRSIFPSSRPFFFPFFGR